MRAAYFKITPELLGEMFFNGVHHFQTKSALPDDAKFIRAWLDKDDGNFSLLYESKSFKDTPEGAKFPQLPRPLLIELPPGSTPTETK